MSVDIGIGVLDFAEFVEDSRGEGVDLRYKFEEFIIWEMFQCEFPIIISLPSIQGDTVEPCIEDQFCGGQRVRNLGQHDHSSK